MFTPDLRVIPEHSQEEQGCRLTAGTELDNRKDRMDTTAYIAISNMTRDQLIMSMTDLFGYSIEEFEGLTMIEIWEVLSDEMQAKVGDYLAGVAV